MLLISCSWSLVYLHSAASMSKPVALILGATGQIGRATVRHLAASSSLKLDIRAGTRDPTSVPESIKLPGVQIVKTGYGDDEQLIKEALSDVDRLFIIPPAIEFAADTVNAVLTAAKQSKVNHVIVLSAPSGGIPPTHKYVCSNGSFYYIEKKTKELFPEATIINHPFFMENNMGFASSVKAKGSFTQSLHPDSKVPWMAVDDAGKFNAAVLSNPEKHKGKYYRLFNDRKSFSDLAAYISEAIGKKIGYNHQTYEQFGDDLRKVGAQEYVVELFSNLYHLIDEQNETVAIGPTQDHFNVTGEQPLTLQQWCHLHAEQLRG